MSPRAAVTAIFFVNGALFGCWAARVPAIQDLLGVGEGGLGLILGCIAAGALAGMPVAGWASARFGSRRVTRTAVAAYCLAIPLPALAGEPLLGGFAAFVLGATGGALDVSMNAHGIAVERRLGRPVLSSFHAAFSAGGLVGAGGGALAAAGDVDVRVNMLALAAAGLALALLAGRRLLPGHVDVESGGPTFVRPPRQLWAIGAVAFCCLLAEGAAADWSAVYVDDSLSASAGVAGLAYVGFSVAMVAVRVAGDRLVDAFGPVRLVRLGGATAAVGLAIALAIGHPVAAIAGFTVLGSGVAAVIPVAFRAGGTIPGVAPGLGLASVSTVGYLGFLVGPPLIGALAELVGLPGALATIVVLCAAFAALAGATRPLATSRREPVPA